MGTGVPLDIQIGKNKSGGGKISQRIGQPGPSAGGGSC